MLYQKSFQSNWIQLEVWAEIVGEHVDLSKLFDKFLS